MKKSKLFLAMFLIASLGASAGENTFIDEMEYNISKRGEAQANYSETHKKYYEIQENILNKNAEFKQEFSDLYDITDNLWDYNPDYFKNLDKKIDDLKIKNAGNSENLKQLKEIEDYISATKEVTLKLAEANFKYETKYDPMWDAPLNGALDKVSLHHKKSFDRIFKKIKERTELIKKYEDSLKTATDKYEIDLTNALLGNRKDSLEHWKKNIEEIAKASGDNITFEDFEKAVKDPLEEEKLRNRIENGKVGEYFKKENMKLKELKSIGVDLWGEYVEGCNGEIIESPTENDKKQNTGILENRLYGIQLEKNLNKEIEKNKVENKKLTDNITENKNNIKTNSDNIEKNKKLIDKKANADEVFTKTETNDLLNNKADKSSLTKINSDIKTNLESVTLNKNNIKINTDSISKINTDFSAIKEDIKNLKANTTTGTSTTTVLDNKPLIDKNTKNIKTNTESIATNKNDIEKNIEDIATNKNNIDKNINNIKTNSEAITTNKNDIDKNITDIATNKNNIDKNSNSIKTNSEAIATNKNDIEKNITDIKEIKDTYVTKDKLNSEVKSAVQVANAGGTKDKNGVNIGGNISKENKSVNVVVAADSANGKETIITGTNNSVFGIGHTVNGNGNTVMGDPTHVDGDGNIVLGNNNNVKGENNTVLGNDIKANKINNAVILGNKSEGETNTVSVGSKDNQRRIINVADAKRDTDAVNLRQLNKVEDKLAGGLASVTAMTSLDTTPVHVGKTKIAAAVGGYNSHQAVAVGVGKKMSEGLNVNFKLGANLGKTNNVTYSTGISYEF